VQAHVFASVVSVLSQEGIRFAVLVLFVKSERAVDSLVRPGGPKFFNDITAAIALGE
jgi:hypothetical protein